MANLVYRDLWRRLLSLYSEGEAKAIIRILLEDGFGIALTDALCGSLSLMKEDDSKRLEAAMERLEKGEPVQYVVGKTMFMGRKFVVGSGCLIPRPETEELCQWIREEHNGKEISILDIGTGSGCIAISLALELQNGKAEGWDISEKALSIATENAERLGADVRFRLRNILEESEKPEESPNRKEGRQWDLIVSNPPYICQKERGEMHQNVKDYEPEEALFVPDDKPLMFYNAIIRYATRTLKEGGMLYFEINPLYAEGLRSVLSANGLSETEIRNDQTGRPRFARATLNSLNSKT